MSRHSVLILIPARYGSQRFPGKPLASLGERSMIAQICHNMQSTGLRYAVVTDHDLIEAEVVRSGGQVVRVDDEVICGTDRIQLAYARFFAKEGPADLIVNVQGDEPLLSGAEVMRLVAFHQQHPHFAITTLVKARPFESCQSEYQNPNVVKAIFERSSGECHWFTRAPAPYLRNSSAATCWHQHIGVYSYQTAALAAFVASPPAHYEQIEGLEQLRALSLGMRLGAIETSAELLGVDTPEDLTRVARMVKSW